MRATHIDYKRPGHLRVEDRKKVLCVPPQAALYRSLFSPGLPVWDEWAHLGMKPDERASMAA